ncbi:MAG: NAD-dependent epimerase/dehydratase family protein [Betaproteobacteria bacterium]
MKIAVIGATGLIGQHAARALVSHGDALRIVHRAGSRLQSLEHLPFETAEADLDDRAALTEALRDVDAVIHCAGYYPRQFNRTEEELAIARRQMGNFCQAALDAGCSKAVYVSAASVLEKPAPGQLADESMVCREEPSRNNPFRLIKWHQDKIAEEYIGRGLPLVFAIPSMVFGEYDHGPTAGRLIVGIANGTLRHYIDCQRNIVAGADLAQGLLRCLAAGRVGERYILAGTNIHFGELVEKIAAAAKVSPPKRVSLVVARALAGLQELQYRMTGKTPSVKRSELAMIASGKFLDAGKAEQELGFKAQIGVDDAIGRALRWFRNNGYVTGPVGP